jgi:phenylalanine ammonia-lyase
MDPDIRFVGNFALGFENDGGVAQVVDHQPVFTYVDDPTSMTYPLMQKLRQVLVEHALKHSSSDGEELDGGGSSSNIIFSKIAVFEEELKMQLEKEVPEAREVYDKGASPIPNRIKDCRSYPLYQFVRHELGTCLLTGQKTQSPGEDFETIYDAISEGKLVTPLLKVLENWNLQPGPFPSSCT